MILLQWLIKKIYKILYIEKKKKFNRSLSFGDYFTDRKVRAELENFGKGSTVYDNVLIIGRVKVGKNVWIGPNCILDGSGGGINIGDNCSISAGVHIYTHETIKIKEKNENEFTYKPVNIGSNTFIGPNSIITKGVNIGNNVFVCGLSLVNRNIPDDKKFIKNKILNNEK